MFRKIKAAGPAACAIVLGSAVLLGQVPKAQKVPGAGASSLADTGTSAADGCVECELPIVLRQTVEAGKTAVGTKVEARLVMATMINGAVLPRGAVISGEVTESVAKSNNSPSRLAIRMDSAQWKNGEAKFKVYLTAWYYPPARRWCLRTSPMDRRATEGIGAESIPPSIPPIHRIRLSGCRLSRTMV